VCDAGPLSTARTDATVSTIGFIAGGVLTAAGLGLVLFAPSKTRSDAATMHAMPIVGPSRAGLAVEGAFCRPSGNHLGQTRTMDVPAAQYTLVASMARLPGTPGLAERVTVSAPWAVARTTNPSDVPQ
jgi:hypothetical protein